MKIDAYSHVAQVHRINEVKAPQRAESIAPVSSDRVSLSGDAAFLTNLSDAMSKLEDVRPDVVEQARADIAAGTLGNEADLQRTVDALLFEL